MFKQLFEIGKQVAKNPEMRKGAIHITGKALEACSKYGKRKRLYNATMYSNAVETKNEQSNQSENFREKYKSVPALPSVDIRNTNTIKLRVVAEKLYSDLIEILTFVDKVKSLKFCMNCKKGYGGGKNKCPKCATSIMSVNDYTLNKIILKKFSQVFKNGDDVLTMIYSDVENYKKLINRLSDKYNVQIDDILPVLEKFAK